MGLSSAGAGRGPTRVVVVGGTGFLGARAVEAMKRSPALAVQVASRSSALRVDLGDPSTFEALAEAEIVVDLADATRFKPDALARWCVKRGKTFVETTSDLPAVDRLASAPRDSEGRGAIVLGAGIFTGLSNLLVQHAARSVSGARRVQLGIRSSPFSGAGAGTVSLMAGMLSVDAVSYRAGERITHPPVGAGPRLTFPSAETPSLRVPLAESVMLAQSTGAADIDVYFAPKPSLLVWAFRSLPMLVLRSGAFAAFMRLYFTFLRRFVLARRPSTTELVAVAQGEGDRQATVTLSAADGMRAGGAAIAAMVVEIAGLAEAPRGTLMIDELLALEPVLARMRELDPGASIALGA